MDEKLDRFLENVLSLYHLQCSNENKHSESRTSTSNHPSTLRDFFTIMRFSLAGYDHFSGDDSYVQLNLTSNTFTKIVSYQQISTP